MAITLHGAGFGLDETEAFDAEIAGIVDGLTAGGTLTSLKSITVVEIDPVRADLLDYRLNQILPGRQVRIGSSRSTKAAVRPTQAIRSAGTASDKKPRLFVAMPFRKEMEDHFEYGILRPSKKCGFVCERADREVFTDDIVQWVKERIASADLVVADLTGSNPNVYLEVGFAWGQSRQTLLLAQNAEELKFDVRNQKCIVYGTIKELEQQVLTTLKSLKRARR